MSDVSLWLDSNLAFGAGLSQQCCVPLSASYQEVLASMLISPRMEAKLVLLNILKNAFWPWLMVLDLRSQFYASFHNHLNCSITRLPGQWVWTDLIWISIQTGLKGVSHGADRKQVAEATTFLLHNWKQTWSPSIPLVVFDGCDGALSCNQPFGFASEAAHGESSLMQLQWG